MENFITALYVKQLEESLKEILSKNKRLKILDVLFQENKYDSNTLNIYVSGNGGWKNEGSTMTMACFEFSIEASLKGQYLKLFIPSHGYVVYNEIATANQILSDYVAKKKHELFV